MWTQGCRRGLQGLQCLRRNPPRLLGGGAGKDGGVQVTLPMEVAGQLEQGQAIDDLVPAHT